MTHYLKDELYSLVQNNEQVFEFIQSGSLDGIWYWDLEKPGNEWMSPEFWRTLGYDPDQQPHLAEAWQDIIFVEDLALSLENFERHSADANHPYDQVVRYRHFDGSTVWIRCRGMAIRDESEKPIRLLGAHIDITEQKLLERRLQRQLQKEEKRNEYLADFAAMASHDLKAPLRRISTYLSLIETELDGANDEVVSMMTVVTENAEFLQKIVDDLLRLSRLETFVSEHKPVPLSIVVERAIENLAGQLHSGQAKVDVNSASLPTVNGIETLLVLLIQNLVSNSLIYCDETIPVISVNGGEDPQSSWIAVSDNGIGIDPKFHSKIFGVFKRLHNRSQYQGGTGIGLTVCERIAKLHHATIEVRSEIGKGTTMHLSFAKVGEKPRSF